MHLQSGHDQRATFPSPPLAHMSPLESGTTDNCFARSISGDDFTMMSQIKQQSDSILTHMMHPCSHRTKLEGHLVCMDPYMVVEEKALYIHAPSPFRLIGRGPIIISYKSTVHVQQTYQRPGL